MSRAVIKNARYKYGLILCCLVVAFSFLIRVEGFGALEAVRVFLGGYPLGRTILILTFVMCISLIQYVNADYIVFFLNNVYLQVRYGKQTKLLYRLLKNILCLNAIFMGLVFMALAISIIICRLPFSQISCQEMLELGVRGFMMCIFYSLMQVILMVKQSEVNTFMMMLVISVFCAFLSRVSIGIFTILPVQMKGIQVQLNFAVCLIYIIGEILFCFRLYQKGERD